jgi:ATP-dependent Clp protease protease subunit
MHPLRNRLQALIQANLARPRQYEIVAKDEEATVYLYDLIDPYWGISAAQFVKDLAQLKAKTVHLRINSPGGDIFEARAIATAVSQHNNKVIAHVDGLAASAASYVALAADEVEMALGSFLMIHQAWALAIGNREDMLKMAELLEKLDGELVAEYVRETGNTEAQVREWVEAETWFTADEAVQNGFADRVAEQAAKAQAAWDLSAYAHAPPMDEPDDDAERAHAERERRLFVTEKI